MISSSRKDEVTQGFHDENTEEHWGASCVLVLRASFSSLCVMQNWMHFTHMADLGPQMFMACVQNGDYGHICLQQRE